MARVKPHDLHVRDARSGEVLKTVRVTVDPDDSITLRRHLLDVMWNEKRADEDRIGEYEIDVHEADERAKEFTFKA